MEFLRHPKSPPNQHTSVVFHLSTCADPPGHGYPNRPAFGSCFFVPLMDKKAPHVRRPSGITPCTARQMWLPPSPPGTRGPLRRGRIYKHSDTYATVLWNSVNVLAPPRNRRTPQVCCTITPTDSKGSCPRTSGCLRSLYGAVNAHTVPTPSQEATSDLLPPTRICRITPAS